MHIVIVDNGRSTHLGKKDFKNALKCIRCGACMNSCPVYRRSGGYSYGHTVPGPIGSILTPGFDLKKYKELPFASSLCGACSDVCPVKIDIHEQLYKWRQIVSEEDLLDRKKKLGLKIGAKILSSASLYSLATRSMRIAMRIIPFVINSKKLNPWTKHRAMPKLPAQSFKAWYQDNTSKEKK